MASPDHSPSKIESLDIHIIIHSLRLVSEHSKYKVQVKCEKGNKKETMKMKKNENSDVVFFESSLEFHLKLQPNKTPDIHFKILEYNDGNSLKDGKAIVEYREYQDKHLEFRDLHLEDCSDNKAIICVSIKCTKKQVPVVSFAEISNPMKIEVESSGEESVEGQGELVKDVIINEKRESKSSSDDENSVEIKARAEEKGRSNSDSSDGDTKEILPSHQNEVKRVEEPPVSHHHVAPNSSSKAQSLEQAEKNSHVGSGDKNCNCCSIL